MRILSTLGVKGVLVEVLRHRQAQGLAPPEISYDPTVLVLRRVRGGERADLALLTSDGIDELIGEGTLVAGSRIDLAKSEVGIAVAKGAPKPDISTTAALKATLLAAKSVVYSRTGQSGILFARLIAQLGIAEAIDARAIVIPSGFTADVVASGRGELAVQQMSELALTPTVDVVGPIPAELQDDLTFSGGIFAGAADAAGASELLHALSRPDLADLYRAKGLVPCAVKPATPA